MQAAYEEYVRASAALEETKNRIEDSPEWDGWELTLLEGRRDAFERYLEKRLEFLERRFDESSEQAMRPALQPTREMGAGKHAFDRWVMAGIAGLLAVAGFSFVRARGLEAELRETREGLVQITRKLEAAESSQRPAIQEVQHTAKPAVAPSQGPPAHWRKVPTTQHVRNSYRFALTRVQQMQKVGPVQVSLRSVDVQRNSANVTVVSAGGKVDMRRLRLHEAVRLWGALELVVDSITPYGLTGRVIEARG
jgi:hypothetical protein